VQKIKEIKIVELLEESKTCVKLDIIIYIVVLNIKKKKKNRNDYSRPNFFAQRCLVIREVANFRRVTKDVGNTVMIAGSVLSKLR
jgi:3'-phosphoadenosine 5'-phosphosulfate sulfotransferase (PAPS reductase)/FAD synthetase